MLTLKLESCERIEFDLENGTVLVVGDVMLPAEAVRILSTEVDSPQRSSCQRGE